MVDMKAAETRWMDERRGVIRRLAAPQRPNSCPAGDPCPATGCTACCPSYDPCNRRDCQQCNPDPEEADMVSKKDPEFEPTSEVTEEERQAKMRAIEQELISKAVASLIGTEPLPALLFVNSDHQVTRVDVDQLPDERSAALLHALMGLAGRRQDMPRRRTLGQI